MLENVWLSTQTVFDAESPVVNSAVDDIVFDAAKCQRGTGVRTRIVDRVKTFRKMIDSNHLPFDFEGLCLTLSNVCRATDEFIFWHSISEAGGSTRQFAGDLVHVAVAGSLDANAVQLKIPMGGVPAL